MMMTKIPSLNSLMIHASAWYQETEVIAAHGNKVITEIKPPIENFDFV